MGDGRRGSNLPDGLDPEVPEVAAAVRALAAQGREEDDDDEDLALAAAAAAAAAQLAESPQDSRHSSPPASPQLEQRLAQAEREVWGLRDELAVAEQRAKDAEGELGSLRTQLADRARFALLQPSEAQRDAEMQLRVAKAQHEARSKRLRERHRVMRRMASIQEQCLMFREDPLFLPPPAELQEQERIALAREEREESHQQLQPSIGVNLSSPDDAYVALKVKSSDFSEQLTALREGMYPVLRDLKDAGDKALINIFHTLWPIVGKHPNPKLAFIRTAKQAMVRTKVLLADAVRCINTALTEMVKTERLVRDRWHADLEASRRARWQEAAAEADIPPPPSFKEVQLAKELDLLKQRTREQRQQWQAKEKQLLTQRDHLQLFLRNLQDKTMRFHSAIFYGLHQLYKHRYRYIDRFTDPLRDWLLHKDARRARDHARYNNGLVEVLEKSTKHARKLSEYIISDESWGADMTALARRGSMGHPRSPSDARLGPIASVARRASSAAAPRRRSSVQVPSGGKLGHTPLGTPGEDAIAGWVRDGADAFEDQVRRNSLRAAQPPQKEPPAEAGFSGGSPRPCSLRRVSIADTPPLSAKPVVRRSSTSPTAKSLNPPDPAKLRLPDGEQVPKLQVSPLIPSALLYSEDSPALVPPCRCTDAAAQTDVPKSTGGGHAATQTPILMSTPAAAQTEQPAAAPAETQTLPGLGTADCATQTAAAPRTPPTPPLSAPPDAKPVRIATPPPGSGAVQASPAAPSPTKDPAAGRGASPEPAPPGSRSVGTTPLAPPGQRSTPSPVPGPAVGTRGRSPSFGASVVTVPTRQARGAPAWTLHGTAPGMTSLTAADEAPRVSRLGVDAAEALRAGSTPTAPAPPPQPMGHNVSPRPYRGATPVAGFQSIAVAGAPRPHSPQQQHNQRRERNASQGPRSGRASAPVGGHLGGDLGTVRSFQLN
eukprot:TRINITY_DN7238_c0_g1_i2.p1 TRINITY_DN7238_c0_g1~~TRINITY_DN7238_c0_g1_i2.p1  ORF type:complete len:985 (+),score=206.57 TRINITY_DN7238_c0_g1_i2:125-2956(+)